MNSLFKFKFDSKDELYFSYFLEELYNEGLISEIQDKISFKISDKFIYNKKVLIKEKYYTPDFVFKTDDVLNDIFPKVNNEFCYIDVKSEYTKHFNSSITFPDRQAMMLEKNGIYVQKIIPYSFSNKKCLFRDTFTPEKVIQEERYKRDGKNGKIGESKIKYKITTFNEWKKKLI